MATRSAPQWSGTPSIKGSSESIQLALLATSLIGVQICWGVEMTYCTPYLLQLGLTKSKLSLVWLAGPLSGLIMQPIVGVMGDRSTSPWGRRRPIMLIGSIIVAFCILVLGWTREIVGCFITDIELNRRATIVLAVCSIYAIDFAINAVQASCRSLIVDTLPISKQQLGSAWASRMASAGHLVGYAAGAVDLNKVFGGALGDTQFKQLTVLSVMALLGSVGTTCYATTERVLLPDSIEDDQSPSILQTLVQIFNTAVNLPSRIRAICWVQFWSWIGWFPFLFYSTTWIGEIYLRQDNFDKDHTSHDTLGDIGRIGSSAMIVFSIISGILSVTLPWIIQSPEDDSDAASTSFLNQYKPTLLNAWTLGNFQFAAAMVFAPFITSVRAATLLVAICALPWALACWAPYTFMGIEINRLSSGGHAVPLTSAASGPAIAKPSIDLSSLDRSGLGIGPVSDSSTGELAGRYLGMLNVYMTIPQFIGSGISMVVFGILEPGKSPELAKDAHPSEHHSTDGVNAIAVCLFIGALSNIMAARAARRLRNTR